MLITVRPLRAEITKDLDWGFWNKMDPYCVIQCDGQSQRTQAAIGKGKRPTWQDALIFRIGPNSQSLTINVWDKDFMSSDDYIGQALVPLLSLSATGRISTSFPLYKHNAPVGTIWVDITASGGMPGPYPPYGPGGAYPAPGLMPHPGMPGAFPPGYNSYPGNYGPYPGAHPPYPGVQPPYPGGFYGGRPY